MLRRKILCIISALLALSLLQPVRAAAASSKEIQKEIDSLKAEAETLEKEQIQLEAQLAENLEQTEEIVAQKNIIDQQITVLYDRIRNTEAQISAMNSLIADNQEVLDAAQEKLGQLRQAYKDRIRAMEEAGTLSYWTVIFEANSFTDLLDRLNMIREIAEADRQRMQQLTDAAQAVETARAALEQKKETLLTAQQQLQVQQTQLDEKRAQADVLLRELISQGAEFEALLEASEEAEQALMEELAKKEEALDEAKYREWLATYVPPAPEQETPGPGNSESSSGWIKPVRGYKLTSPFGMRTHPVTGQYKMHNGVDLACPEGTPIYAAKGGQISAAAWDNSAGNFVQIDHGGGYRSIYMHMTRFVVSPGQYVAQGQVIGYVGDTGVSKGSHLHFGISVNGSYVNPMGYI